MCDSKRWSSAKCPNTTSHWTVHICPEIRLDPGSTLLPQLTPTESEKFIDCTGEVTGVIRMRIKHGPIFDEINYISHSLY